MTRGTMYLYLGDRICESPEFNGDMYYDCYGKQVVQALAQIRTEEEFADFVKRFNEKNFGYEEVKDEGFVGYYSGTRKFTYREMLDFSDEYFKKFFSDFLYIKNESGKELMFSDASKKPIILPDGAVGVIDYGETASDVPEELNGFRKIDEKKEIASHERCLEVITGIGKDDAAFVSEQYPCKVIVKVFENWDVAAEKAATESGVLTKENHMYFDIEKWTTEFIEKEKKGENYAELPSGKIVSLY